MVATRIICDVIMLLLGSQCKTRNYPEEFECARCGGSSGKVHRYRRKSDCDEEEERSDGDASGGGEEINDCGVEEEYDEFGRLVRRPQTKKKSKKLRKTPERREWPPLFDVEGTAFTFDNRSAMFYDAESDFFYDVRVNTEQCVYITS